MDPYNYQSTQPGGQQANYRHSLSSTTAPPYQPSHGGYPAAPQPVAYPHPSTPYAVYPQATGSQMAMAQAGDPRSGYGGQALRELPFTTGHQAGMQPQLQAHGAYANMHPSAGAQYAHPYAAAGAQAGYHHGSAHQAVPTETRYIPTPAQTMQSYQTLPSRGSALAPPKSSPSPGVERYACDKCDRTFSRPHDRKRHHESQHLQTSHSCQYCRKEFSRADSLKRHLDNGCDKMPVS
ncbi:uncharacterized protein C8Q71DRAFT_498309 [Rhodofomes roseus]|uniref:C2H2-type domain-containing protein n=1 Tax=Rhodofomes roseus TaxID=34475 RepID=A0A4Y9Y286_9APHY|nr:uncharacterized protein C8Q71DRAFT_498309 [Rhodofomes roseus]KAH9839137.1 hypothetical protein C8Q71DRAFT_498309 [Rhodofomes roseus]TFY56370.1 hypothetical protein EVJ58_g7687 [Rhodofomes roseus]